MSEQDFNILFAKNLKKYLDKYDYSQAYLAEKLHVSPQSVSNWCKAVKSPRMDKVDAMCELFHCRRSDLMLDESQREQEEEYYINPQTKDIAQQIYENKELSLLFDAAKDASPEDLETVHSMLLALKRKEKNQ